MGLYTVGRGREAPGVGKHRRPGRDRFSLAGCSDGVAARVLVIGSRSSQERFDWIVIGREIAAERWMLSNGLPEFFLLGGLGDSAFLLRETEVGPSSRKKNPPRKKKPPTEAVEWLPEER
jgi:hypothetical protein